MSNKKADSDMAAGTAGAVERAEQTVKQPEIKFEKKQLIVSKKYAADRDLVDALLDDKKLYTLAEVDNLINKYRKGMVK